MGRIINQDIISGSSVTSTLSGGASAVRVFYVEDLTGPPSNRLFEALTVGGIPRVGDPHPASQFVICDNVTVSPLTDSNTQAMVTASYKPLTFGSSNPDEEGQTQIRLGSTVQSVTTNKFFQGSKSKFMRLKYKFEEGDQNSRGLDEEEQIGEVEKQVPITTASFSRQESQRPLKKSQLYVGKTNSSTFLDGKKNTWLCTDITGNTTDGGETYSVNYEFAFNSETWSPVVSYINPETRLPPVGAFTEAGAIKQPDAVKSFQIYQTIDFNKLKLD
jgi:hypothetical protein